MDVRRCRTPRLSAAELVGIRALLFEAFDDYTEHDWAHATGGVHVFVVEGDEVVAHGAIGRRRLRHGGRDLEAGYIESVAVRADRRGRGLGSVVMEGLEVTAADHDLLALSATAAGLPLYLSRDWQRWRGPTSVATPRRVERTPDDDSICVLPGRVSLDLDGELTCDWRLGDVW